MASSKAQSPEASARLEAVTNELQEIVTVLKSGEIDERVLSDFRQTIDYLRMTAWARHQAQAERAQGRDFRSVLSLLTSDRISRATQLAEDIHHDLSAIDALAKSEEIRTLLDALKPLIGRLESLLGGS